MIWCVEDDASIRDIEVYALESTGFESRGFDDGAAVTSKATEESAVGLTPLDSGLSQAYDDSTARLPWYERITAPISGGIIEQRHVSIPDDVWVLM